MYLLYVVSNNVKAAKGRNIRSFDSPSSGTGAVGGGERVGTWVGDQKVLCHEFVLTPNNLKRQSRGWILQVA